MSSEELKGRTVVLLEILRSPNRAIMYYLGGQSPLFEVLAPLISKFRNICKLKLEREQTQMEAGGNPGQGAANLTAAKKEDTQEKKNTEK